MSYNITPPVLIIRFLWRFFCVYAIKLPVNLS